MTARLDSARRQREERLRRADSALLPGLRGRTAALLLAWPAWLLALPLPAQPFGFLSKYQPGTGVSAQIQLVDLDGDGDLDMLLDGYWVYANDGTSRFSRESPFPPPPCNGCAFGAFLAQTGDVDGDLDLDVVFATAQFPPPITSSKTHLYLYVGDGAGGYAPAPNRFPVYLSEANLQRGMALGDLNGDGHLDLVVVNDGIRNRLYFNDGTGMFTDASTTHLPYDTNHSVRVALADLDGDLDLDIVFVNHGVRRSASTEPNRIHLNDGQGRFTELLNALPDLEHWTDVAVGDVDGDGDQDLVFTSEFDNQMTVPGRVHLYLNDGQAGFTDASARMPPEQAMWQAALLADMDGDGDRDLFVGLWTYGVPSLRSFENDGAGMFTERTSTEIPPTAGPVLDLAAGDLDGDTDLDLVFPNQRFFNSGTRVYTNLQRQLYAPVPAQLGRLYGFGVYSLPGDVALPMMALGGASISLGPLGVFGLDPTSVVFLPPLTIPASGVALVAGIVPNDPSLLHPAVELYSQAMVLDLNGVGRVWMSTNVAMDRIQR